MRFFSLNKKQILAASVFAIGAFVYECSKVNADSSEDNSFTLERMCDDQTQSIAQQIINEGLEFASGLLEQTKKSILYSEFAESLTPDSLLEIAKKSVAFCQGQLLASNYDGSSDALVDAGVLLENHQDFMHCGR